VPASQSRGRNNLGQEQQSQRDRERQGQLHMPPDPVRGDQSAKHRPVYASWRGSPRATCL